MNALHGPVARRGGFEPRPYWRAAISGIAAPHIASRSPHPSLPRKRGREGWRPASLMRATSWVASALLGLSLWAGDARAQTLAELAAYSGPDRTQRLVAGAK